MAGNVLRRRRGRARHSFPVSRSDRSLRQRAVPGFGHRGRGRREPAHIQCEPRARSAIRRRRDRQFDRAAPASRASVAADEPQLRAALRSRQPSPRAARAAAVVRPPPCACIGPRARHRSAVVYAGPVVADWSTLSRSGSTPTATSNTCAISSAGAHWNGRSGASAWRSDGASAFARPATSTTRP